MHSDEQQVTETNDWRDKLNFLKLPNEKKEKIAIIFLLGIFFLLIANPLSSASTQNQIEEKESKQGITDKKQQIKENDEYIEMLENKLEQTIKGMEGAGKVQVMITLKDGGEKILDKNQPYESSSEVVKEEGKESELSTMQSESETVLIDVDGNTSPIIVREMYPDIEGVVVVCEGGDNAIISLRIREAVQALFSIEPHKIVVCKLQES